jgi:hypothetical protein
LRGDGVVRERDVPQEEVVPGCAADGGVVLMTDPVDLIEVHAMIIRLATSEMPESELRLITQLAADVSRMKRCHNGEVCVDVQEYADKLKAENERLLGFIEQVIRLTSESCDSYWVQVVRTGDKDLPYLIRPMERNYGAEAYARVSEENEQLREALGFYGDEGNWIYKRKIDEPWTVMPALNDRGEIARAATVEQEPDDRE